MLQSEMQTRSIFKIPSETFRGLSKCSTFGSVLPGTPTDTVLKGIRIDLKTTGHRFRKMFKILNYAQKRVREL